MELIYPMFAMVILTAVVGGLTGFSRIRSASTGKIDPRYFRLMSNYDIPAKVAQLGRNFDNLFEVPVLFYAAGVAALALQINSPVLYWCMWAFVALRVVHTIIHISYNHPLHRFVPFALSFVCVVAVWVQLLLFVCEHQ